MSLLGFRLAIVFWLVAPVACGAERPSLGRSELEVLNGGDDRLELFEAPAGLRSTLLASSAALIFTHRLVERAPDVVELRAPTAGAAFGLCPDEAFSSQPSAAFCSGILVDDDLIATAGHCLGTDTESATRRCRDLRIVFGYSLPGVDGLAQLDASQVFGCRRLVTREQDIAIIQLDRAALAPLRPTSIAKSFAGVDDRLIVASYAAGLPLKIELAARVTAVAPDQASLTIAMDTFAGSSGGGIYNAGSELVGLVAGGAPDWVNDGECVRAAHSEVPRERASVALSLEVAVCSREWPSERLCGTKGSCGDHICTPTESGACVADCPIARCGDSLCEPSERGRCTTDCARYVDVPESWMDEPGDYHSSTPQNTAVTSGSTPSCSAVRVAAWPTIPLPLTLILLTRIRNARSRRQTNKQVLRR
jgi:hypothetical protein